MDVVVGLKWPKNLRGRVRLTEGGLRGWFMGSNVPGSRRKSINRSWLVFSLFKEIKYVAFNG